MKSSDLKNGKEFRYKTPDADEDLREAEVSYSERLGKYCIWFNGKLFSFKNFHPMLRKLGQLKKDFKLSLEN